MKTKGSFSIVLLLLFSSLIAQNPIVPPGIYFCDPEAHIWEDGKIYLYGSRDESNEYWCSHKYHVMVSENLEFWDVVENAFSSKGNNDQIVEHNKLLYAPDCAYKGGQYYLYYCSPGRKQIAGVATSKSPLGPFVDGKNIVGADEIDPSVFIDDDGQAYYVWGQLEPKIAKLKANMTELDSSSIVLNPLDKAGTAVYHEGPSIRKFNNRYYLVFADESREDKPTCLGYALSENPMGPYVYQGILIDNNGCDPKALNNQGCIEIFDDQGYVFYHRATNNSQKFRKTCIERICFQPDGTIAEVEMTSQGASEHPLSAFDKLPAEWACFLSGSTYIGPIADSDIPNDCLKGIGNNDFSAFKYLNFNRVLKSLTIKAKSDKKAKIEVRMDSEDGRLLGVCHIEPSTGSAYSLSSHTINCYNGEHALYLIFKDIEEGTNLEVDWLQFSK